MRYQLPVLTYTDISSDYGPRHDPGVHQEPGGHPGIDYPMSVGTTVTAAAAGVVERASNVKGYGRTVIVKHADGNHYLYGHLESPSVEVGDKVDQGDELGKSGHSGNSNNPHLHFSVLRDVNIPEYGPFHHYDPAINATDRAGAGRSDLTPGYRRVGVKSAGMLRKKVGLGAAGPLLRKQLKFVLLSAHPQGGKLINPFDVERIFP